MFALRLIIKLVGLLRIHLESIPAQWTIYSYRATQEISSPFSFWKNIYLNPLNHAMDEYEKIFKHEQVHVNQLHTLDILISEISILIFWYNPFCWLTRHAIVENIEFVTDRKVISSGIDKQSYQFSLLNFSTLSPKQSILGNHFNLQNLKKRIAMMNKKETAKQHIGKYVLILPAIVFGSLIFSVSKAYENPAEGNLLKPILSEAFQDTSRFQNLDSLEFQLRNSKAPSFGNVVSNENALVLLDGEKINKKKMNSINPEHIKEICVYKGEEATRLYGEEGKDGVIFITTKAIKPRESNPLKNGSNTLPEDTLFILDGKKVDKSEFDKLNPEEIKKMEVLKGEKAIEAYGEKGKNGVIIITTK